MTNYSTTVSANFSIGGVISTSFNTLNKDLLRLMSLNILPWIIIAALIMALVFFLPSSPGAGMQIAQSPGTGVLIAALLGIALFFFAYVACQAATCFAVAEKLLGRNYGFGQAIGIGISRLPKMIGIALVALVAYFIGALVIGTIAAFIVAILPQAAAMFIIGLGAVIIAAMLVCMYFVVFPVASVEDAGVLRSYGRSRFLTYGNRWKIFGLYLVLGVGLMLASYLVAWILASILPAVVALLAYLLIMVWSATLLSVAFAVTYFRLREAKEGVSLGQIAEVF